MGKGLLMIALAFLAGSFIPRAGWVRGPSPAYGNYENGWQRPRYAMAVQRYWFRHEDRDDEWEHEGRHRWYRHGDDDQGEDEGRYGYGYGPAGVRVVIGGAAPAYGYGSGRPPGWDRGRKVGWRGCDVPPGLAKKVGCGNSSFYLGW